MAALHPILLENSADAPPGRVRRNNDSSRFARTQVCYPPAHDASSLDLLASVIAARPARFGGFDALAVDDPGARACLVQPSRGPPSPDSG